MAMKGPNYSKEVEEAKGAMEKLKITNFKFTILNYNLPENMGERYLLIFKKDQPTPSHYPRAIGVPSKSPL